MVLVLSCKIKGVGTSIRRYLCRSVGKPVVKPVCGAAGRYVGQPVGMQASRSVCRSVQLMGSGPAGGKSLGLFQVSYMCT